MTIYLGADHRGYALKEYVRKVLVGEGYAVVDCGNRAEDTSDDYPDFAHAVAARVAAEPVSRGILFCGSGNGVAIAANKIHGIRAAVAMNARQARSARSDDDANIIAIAADYVERDEARDIIEIFLATPFSGASRHERRIGKLE
jgi:ribose 5-phosphate isomerase B